MYRKKLILIMGVPASGKTTIAKLIIKKKKAVYLDNNFIADAFFPRTRVDKEYKKIRKSIYKAIYRITSENLKLGNSVILDIPHITHMMDKNWRIKMRRLTQKANTQLKIIRCYCSEETLKNRMKNRGEKRDKWKLLNWEKFLQKEPIFVKIPFEHIDINTEKKNKENIREIMEYLQA